MQIEIKNCNNIDSGVIQLVEKHLNIKYAINGTGKSTISKAIYNAVTDRENGTNKLLELIPFKASTDVNIKPSLIGVETIRSVKIFDETYINEFIFQSDELLKGSFDIFIRCADYDDGIVLIEALVAEVKNLLSEDQDIEKLISDFNELSGSFGRQTKAGIHASSAIAKAFKDGNKVSNIPQDLEMYKDYIQHGNNYKWIKWQLEGKQFIDITDNCPYCVNDITEQKEIIDKVGEIYEVKAIENLNKIVAVFQRLNKYFSDETKTIIDDFIKNIDEYTTEQVGYLKEVKDQVDRLNKKFSQAKNIGFFSLKDVDVNQVIERLKTYTIDITLYNHLKSEDTLEKVTKINEAIEQLLKKAGELQGRINVQKKLIEKLVDENKVAINSFLCNAGYKYSVDLIEDEKGKHKLKLIHVDVQNEVKDVKARLSYGERNAFALVLFMFDALKNQPDLVVLDDPISSFDKNKKYAIVEMLFRKESCFRDKTVLLLSHDFEPIVDIVYHHSNRFKKPFAAFLENNHGVLSEREIKKIDVQTFIEINENNISNGENIISKLVYLRRTYEIINAKGTAYQLVSNVFHKKSEPEFRDKDEAGNMVSRMMTLEEINQGAEEIQQKIPEFNYTDVIGLVSDRLQMIDLYNQLNNNYEKLHIYRIIFDGNDESIKSDVIQKFIKQAFHIENDYIYQLNPATFQTVPQYVIDECNRCFSDE